MKTIELSADAPDREYQVPTQIIEWMDSSRCKNARVKSEVALAVRGYLRTGRFSINRNRYQHSCGGQASAKMRHFLDSCPYVATTRAAVERTSTAVYEFRGVEGFRASDQHGETLAQNQSPDIYSPPNNPPTCPLTPLSVSGEYLYRRAVRWDEWCDLRPSERVNRVDYFRRREMTRYILDVIVRVELPGDQSFIDDLSDATDEKRRVSEREWCRSYLEHRAENPIVEKVTYTDGRIYHPLTTCPRPIRQRMTLDGEPVGEADLSCSFYALLAGQLPAGADRTKAVDWVTSGEFYDRLQGSAGTEYVGAELKIQAQIQCLFHADHHPLSLRPLGMALRREIPAMADLIHSVRRRVGPSGLCRYLTQLEGGVMSPAHRQLMGQGVPFLPLHDGIVVRQSDVAIAAEEIRAAGEAQLGFMPLVKAK